MKPCPDPRFDELLAPYALGACPPDEADRVRAHLELCPACALTLHELSAGRDALLTDVPAQAAPPELKARVMDRVRADAELFGAAGQRPSPAPRRGLAQRLRLPALGLAAALIVALVVGTVALTGGGSDRGERTIPAQVNARTAPGASAELVVRDGRARLVVSGMPDPGAGRVYEVWLQRGDAAPQPTSALFSVSAGDGAGETSIPGDIGDVDRVLVTSEPAGGSQQPTRAPVIVAAV